MIPREEIAAVLDDFTKKVIQQARRNLTLFSGNKTKALHRSFNRDIQVFKDSMKASISALDYWRFTNYGVKGIEKQRIGVIPNEFGKVQSYKTGIENKPGYKNFLTDKINRPVSKSQAIATSWNVWKFGIKGTGFFTRPFDTAFIKVSKEIENVYGLVIEKELGKELNDISGK